MSAVPKLRFSEFDGEWIYVTIQTLIDEKTLVGHLDGNHGELYPRSEEFASFGVPYVSANDLIDGLVDLERSKRLPADRAKKFKKGIAKTGDLLFAHNATVGPVALLETDFDYVILSTTVTYFRFNEDRYSSKFALNIFQSENFVRQYSRVMSQSTRNQVPISQQRKFFVPKPSLPEQQKIASFLSSVDKKIDLLRQKKDALELYKKGLMQKIFSQEIRFKQDDGSDFPDWEEVALGGIAERVKTKNTVGNNNVLTISAQKGLVSQLEYFNKSVSSANLSGYTLLHKGDFAYNKSYSNGYPVGAIKRLNYYLAGVVSPLYICFSAHDKQIADYLEIYLDSDFVVQDISKIMQEGARNHGLINISVSDFFEFVSIPLPCVDERVKIVSFLSNIDIKIQGTSSQIEQMETFKKGLLQQMFV